MRRVAVLAGIASLAAACSILPIEPELRIARQEVECIGIEDLEGDMCQRMIDTVRDRFPADLASAIRIIVVDTCPPRLLCDRAFIYHAAVVMIPGIGDPLIAHVFGHMGEPLSVERWKGPLPEHVATLIP